MREKIVVGSWVVLGCVLCTGCVDELELELEQNFTSVVTSSEVPTSDASESGTTGGGDASSSGTSTGGETTGGLDGVCDDPNAPGCTACAAVGQPQRLFGLTWNYTQGKAASEELRCIVPETGESELIAAIATGRAPSHGARATSRRADAPRDNSRSPRQTAATRRLRPSAPRRGTAPRRPASRVNHDCDAAECSLRLRICPPGRCLSIVPWT